MTSNLENVMDTYKFVAQTLCVIVFESFVKHQSWRTYFITINVDVIIGELMGRRRRRLVRDEKSLNIILNRQHQTTYLLRGRICECVGCIRHHTV